MTVGLCDLGHQAIAFLGTCPLCRRKPSNRDLLNRNHAPSELVEGVDVYKADLDEALRAHYVGRLQQILDGHLAVLNG